MDKVFHVLKGLCKSIAKVMPPEGIKDFRQWKNSGLVQKEFLKYVETSGSTTETTDIFEDDIAHTIARTWLKQEKTKNGIIILRKYKGQWYSFKDVCYELLEDESFRGQLYRFLESKSFYKENFKGETSIMPYKPTRAKVADIIDSLNHWCPIIKEPPIWLTDKERTDPSKLIVFQNGILDVQKYIIDGSIRLYDATPELFATNVLPYEFDEHLESEIWYDFLDQIFNGDRRKIQLLSQWFGYNCLPDMSYEKLMLFTGRPRSGKSTVLDTMQSMLGENQCCQTSFQSLTGAFGYQLRKNTSDYRW